MNLFYLNQNSRLQFLQVFSASADFESAQQGSVDNRSTGYQNINQSQICCDESQ